MEEYEQWNSVVGVKCKQNDEGEMENSNNESNRFKH